MKIPAMTPSMFLVILSLGAVMQNGCTRLDSSSTIDSAIHTRNGTQISSSSASDLETAPPDEKGTSDEFEALLDQLDRTLLEMELLFIGSAQIQLEDLTIE